MINAFIQGSYVKLDGRKAGVQGESRSKILRLTFSPEWKDLEKSILWQDARGETVVRVPLVPTSAEINEYGGLRIDTKIPGEALAYAGECAFTVTGYDLTDSARTLSAETVMQVEENELAGKEAVNAQDPTPDAVEQLQNAVTKAANDVARFAAAAENSALESRDYMNAATDASLEAEASKEAAASSESDAANWASVAGQCASRSADSLTLVLAAQADVAQDTNEAKAAKSAAETAAEEAKQAKTAAESAKNQANTSAESAAASSAAVGDAVKAAQKAADDAEQAARDAKAAADSVQDVSADAAAAKAAAQAATQAMVAAQNARDAAQLAATLAADDAARLAAQGVENRLAGYVTDAENAKDAAQSAAGTAATDAANAVNSQLAQHVAAAQAAQAAAEKARDEAQAIAGGDFVPSSRTVNGKALSEDITLDADDVGAVKIYKIVQTLSTTGWYRVCEIDCGQNDYRAGVIKFSISGSWGRELPTALEIHVSLSAYKNAAIIQMPTHSGGTQINLRHINKVRVCKINDNRFAFDIYYASAFINGVSVAIQPTFVGVDLKDLSSPYDGADVANAELTLTEEGFLGELDPNNLTEPVPIEKGGTDAASAEDARNNLGAEKAGAAQLVFDKIISKKDQLIVNGSASLADNTGISALRFDGSQAYFSRGSFTYDNGKLVYFFCDDFFEIDPRKSYEFSFDLKSKNGVARMYSFLTFFDADHNEIWQQNYYFRTGSTTKLAKDLVAGDTVVYLEDVSGWSKEWQLGTLLTVWNYKNSFGYQYAPETYTRNYYPISRSGQYPTDDAIDHANNTVKLQTAYSGATIPAGTYVSQGYDGNGWGYKPCNNTIAPTEWTHFSAVIDPAYIRPGAIFTRYGFFWNDRSEDDQVWGTNFVLKELSGGVTTAEMNTAISSAVGSINTVLDEINGEVV